MRTSSNKKDTTRAPANGHPTIAPMPNHIIPRPVFRPPRQSMNAEMPSIEVYIVKLDGSIAVDAWNIPGLNTKIVTNMTPIRGWSVREMAANILVSQAAHMNASAILTK